MIVNSVVAQLNIRCQRIYDKNLADCYEVLVVFAGKTKFDIYSLTFSAGQ